MRPLTVALIGAILFTVVSSPIPASTIRHDQTWADYESLADDFSSTVGLIYEYTNDGTYIGSGTIISSDVSDGTWILTAAHVIQDATTATFTINGTTYQVDSWNYYSYVTDATLTDDGVGDIALIHISDEVDDAVPASLYMGTTEDLLGSVATYAGYGCTGTGMTGYTSTSYGTLHAVQNMLDTTAAEKWGTGNSDSVLLCDFDSPTGVLTATLPLSSKSANFSFPLLATNVDGSSADPLTDTTVVTDAAAPSPNNSMGSATPLELEGLIAPGDSGGGVFVTIDDVTYLAGVNSFISWTDGIGNSDYGDIAGCVSVCDFIDWITETTGLSLTKIPGDANEDGVVDGSDATILAGYWMYGSDMENPDATWSMGDFNEDGVVDGSDAVILAGHWQENAHEDASVSTNGTLTSVPEPSTWCLLASLLLWVAQILLPRLENAGRIQ